MDELKRNIKTLKNATYKKIMYRLINIYEDECLYNEGSLGFNDILIIFNLFYFLDRSEKC